MAEIEGLSLLKLRNRPHRSRVHLGVFKPQTIVAAQINDSDIEKGARELTVDVLSGDLGDIENGMTLYIGATEEGREISRIRAISGGAGKINIAENSFDWQDGWYVTVTNFHEPWAVFPRITLSDDFVPTDYRDYDNLYNQEHTNWQPVVNMGGNVAAFKEGAGANIYYSASGSYAIDDSITDYLWEFDGGSPINSTALNPGNILYTGSGYFTTKLTATTASGKTYTGVRHVMIYDRYGTGGDNPPIQAWGLKSLNGSRDEGGYQASFWIRESADKSVIADNALIVLFTEDWEAGQAGKLGGNNLGRSNQLFVGYVKKGSIKYNAFDDVYDFDVVSITGVMRGLSTYSATFESKKSTSNWLEVSAMTVDKAAIAYLQDMSTVLKVADYHRTEDTRHVQYADMARGNLYDSLAEFLGGTIFASAVSDRQGGIWTEIDASLQPTGTRSIPTLLDLSDQDWRDDISIPELITPSLAYVEFGGIAYSGPETGTYTPHMTSAPGDPAGYFGRVERSQGLVLTGQNQLNVLAALAWNKSNSIYREIPIPMAGDYRVIDIAPQKRLTLSLAPSDTYRGLVWYQKKFLPSEVSYRFDPTDEALIMDISVNEETEGAAVAVGITIDIPVDPPYDVPIIPEWQLPTFTFPPWTFPPIGDVPTIEPPPPEEIAVVLLATSNNIIRTFDWANESPTWDLVTGIADLGTPASAYRVFYVSPLDGNRAFITSNKEVFMTSNLLDPNPVNVGWSKIIDEDLLKEKSAKNFVYAITDISVNPVDGSALFLFRANDPGPQLPWYLYTSDYVNFTAGFLYTGGSSSTGDKGRPFIKHMPDGNIVYVSVTGASRTGYLAVSFDGGLTFPQSASIALDATATNGDGIRGLAPLGGNSFTLVGSENNQFVDSPATPKNFFSADGGHSRADTSFYWGGFLWSTGNAYREPQQVNDTTYYCSSNGAVYAIMAFSDPIKDIVYAVTLDGFSWQFLTYFPESEGAQTFRVHPANSARHYGHKNAEPYGSFDGGFTWESRVGNSWTLMNLASGFLPQSRYYIIY